VTVATSSFADLQTATAPERARWIREAGGLDAAIDAGLLEQTVALPLVE